MTGSASGRSPFVLCGGRIGITEYGSFALVRLLYELDVHACGNTLGFDI
jgi:hypothetical protein